MEAAEAGGVMVTRTVRDLVAGSSFDFAPRGTDSLDPEPGRWDLASVR